MFSSASVLATFYKIGQFGMFLSIIWTHCLCVHFQHPYFAVATHRTNWTNKARTTSPTERFNQKLQMFNKCQLAHQTQEASSIQLLTAVNTDVCHIYPRGRTPAQNDDSNSAIRTFLNKSLPCYPCSLASKCVSATAGWLDTL